MSPVWAGRFFTTITTWDALLLLLLLLLSCFSRVRPCETPERAAHQAPRPWDSPGKNTGVGCHFLLQCLTVKVKSLSRVRLSGNPWTAAYQAPRSMGFSRQEHWSGVPLPSLHESLSRYYCLPNALYLRSLLSLWEKKENNFYRDIKAN